MTYSIIPANDIPECLSDEWRSFASSPGNVAPALVAIADGRVAAIGRFQRNLLHPNPVHFEYMLVEGVSTECMTLLLDGLIIAAGLVPDDQIHLTGDTCDEAMATWAYQMGFTQRMVTWQCSVTPTDLGEITIPAGLFRLADHDSPELRRQLAILHANIYRAAHYWNPPSDLIDKQADDLFMGCDLLSEYMWYAVDANGEPIGVASLRRSEADDCVELGWVGTLPVADIGLKDVLIDVALHAVRGRTILIEVDENETELMTRLRQLPTRWESASIRFERVAQPAS